MSQAVCQVLDSLLVVEQRPQDNQATMGATMPPCAKAVVWSALACVLCKWQHCYIAHQHDVSMSIHIQP